MTVSSGAPGQSVDVAAVTKMYQRLAAMDPPAMRSLVVELARVADESAATALRQGTVEAAATADRNAQRAAAAQAALATIDGKALPLAQE